MEQFEIGMRYPSYKMLMESLEEFCEQTNSKFWKRDARTISASRSLGVQKFLNPDLKYYEIKFTCIYGGMDFKSKGRSIRNRVPSLKSNGCPAYLRFKAAEDGEALQLVALNLNHNHELVLPKKKTKRKDMDVPVSPKRKKSLHILKEMDNVEIEQENAIEHEEEEEIVSTSEVMDYVELQYPDVKLDPSTSSFNGLIAPVFTPFNDDLNTSLNLDLIPSYAQYLCAAGITGVLVNGTTGEGTSMTVEERKLVTDVWAQVCAQTEQHLMVQVGGAPLPDVVELAQHAEQKGVNSLLCLPELYHKPKTTEELIKYLQVIAQAAPNTPLFYYHIPSLTNVNIHMGAFLNEVQDQISSFSGIKFTSTILDEGVAAVKAHKGKFSVFLGADTIMAGAYTLGFEMAIATTLNMFPDHGQRILQCIKEGNISEAQNAQEELNTAIEIITKNGTWVPTMKEAMSLLTPINPGPVREPLTALTLNHVKQMEDELKTLSFIQT